MALEEDLRATIKEIRWYYGELAKLQREFLEKWEKVRQDQVLPAFRRAVVVFMELEWQSENDASNSSAILRLGDTSGAGGTIRWLYGLALKPDLASRQIEIHTVNKDPERRNLDALTPPVIDRIITEFAKRAETDLQKRMLPS